MATVAAVAPVAIDLRATSNFNIRLGSSILKPRAAKKFASVRYNHKPRPPGTNDYFTAEIRIAHDAEEDNELSLKLDSDEYKYSGRNLNDGKHYVLLYQGDASGEGGMVLERVENCHEFNLVSTPTESDVAKLEERYPPLPFDEGNDDDDLFGDEDDQDFPVEEDNPFDYRHFLNASPVIEAKPDPPPPPPPPPPRQEVSTIAVAAKPKSKATSASLVATKTSKLPAETSTPRNGKRKAGAETSKAKSKRVKAGAESPPPESTKPKPATATSVPKVKLDRRASSRKSSFDDSGELILENEAPVSDKPTRQSAMSLALNRQLGSGPISLLSAASSPAGCFNGSPAGPKLRHRDEDDEINLGGNTDDEDDNDDIAVSDEDEYEDTTNHNNSNLEREDFELPSPAANTQRRSGAAAAAAVSDLDPGDEEDDLSKELALAFDEDDDAGVGATQHIATQPAESDEESEEE